MKKIFLSIMLASLTVTQPTFAAQPAKDKKTPVEAPSGDIDRLTSTRKHQDDVVPYTPQNSSGWTSPNPLSLLPGQQTQTPLPPVAIMPPVETKAVDVAPTPVVEEKKYWVIPEGKTLKETLNAWSKEAGWKLIWNSDHDYIIQAGAELGGSFEDASQKLIEAYAKSTPPIVGDFYSGNNVLVVSKPANQDLN